MRTTKLGTLLSLSLLFAACDDSGSSTPDLSGADLSSSVDQRVAGFKVGGTAAGVAGTGLLLALNGAVDLPVMASGAFSFPTALLDGASYSVTVKAQPTLPAQTCVVTNGTGTIAGADVTSVSVTCTTPSFRVGGTVIGYQGSGLQLRNNGGDDLAVAANGAFHFATPVASGAAYAVTVLQQPGSPAQTCMVAGATGMVGSADVSSVVVNCAANSYTVGGSVEGVVGSVELSLNGQYTVAVAANSTYAFGVGLADLSPYNVTVKTAPGPNPAQTCTVDKGMGQIAGANVSNVKVVCVNNSYPVRVKVLGLGAGASVTLQNHGGNNLVATSNSTWTFSASQETGTAIAVAVSQNPGPIPTQTCVFTAGDVAAIVYDRPLELELTCTSTPYHVKGTVTGLPMGQSVTVSNDGTDQVVNTDGGGFDLGVVLSGLPYKVTVTAQPAAPTYCSVIQGQGLMAGSDTAIAVVCSVPADCAELFALNPTLPSGLYPIDPDGVAGAPYFQAYCDMVTAGGGWTIVYAATGANGEQPLISDVAQNGNPLTGQHHNLTRAQKMALSALSTESLFSRTNDESWLRASKPMFDQNLNTPSSRSAVAIKLVSNDGATADAFFGYSNYDITGGGDFGISMAPDGGTCNNAYTTTNGFDQHSGTYRHLNCNCQRHYLYSYSYGNGTSDLDGDAGYDVNTGLGRWYGSDSCASGEGGNLRFLAAMRRSLPAPASCAAVLAGNPAATSGVYLLSSAQSGMYPAYCDMSGGWTLLGAAIGTNSFWGNTSQNWRGTQTRSAPPTDLGNLQSDHRSGAYGTMSTNAVRLCYGGVSNCYTFSHGLNLALAQFFIQGVSYVKYAYDAVFSGDTGSDGDRSSFIAQLGFGMGTINCYALGINYPNMGFGLGLLGDGNGGCASMYDGGSNFWMDDYALGLGLNSCADGDCAPSNLTQAGASQEVYDDTYGSWYVFGK